MNCRVEGLLAEYEVTVLEALEETDRALVNYTNERARLDVLRQAEAASQRAAKLSQQRFQDGVADFLAVLDAELRLLETQDQRAEAHTRTATALVAVYKSLGGGWEHTANDVRLPSDLEPRASTAADNAGGSRLEPNGRDALGRNP